MNMEGSSLRAATGLLTSLDCRTTKQGGWLRGELTRGILHLVSIPQAQRINPCMEG